MKLVAFKLIIAMLDICSTWSMSVSYSFYLRQVFYFKGIISFSVFLNSGFENCICCICRFCSLLLFYITEFICKFGYKYLPNRV